MREKNRNDQLWNKHFESLKRFVEQFHRYPTTFEIYEEFRLGKWFMKQFSLINDMMMYEDREKKFIDYINSNKIKRRTYNGI